MLEGVVKNSGLEREHENVNGKVSQRTEIMAAHGLRKFFVVQDYKAGGFDGT